MKDRAKIFFNDWEIIPSANYCYKVADGTHDTPKPLDNGKKLITSTHLKDGRINIADAYSISEYDFVSINRRSKVEKWDVLFSMIGTVGEIVLVKDEPDFAIKNLGLFKNKNETEGWWLYYYLSSKIGQAIIETYSTGSSQRFVSLGDLRKLPILNPPDDYKISVINILKSYDDLIEINNKRITLLEQMAEQIYKEWFVRMRFPGYQNTEFEKGVPKGWDVKPLASITNILMGQSPKSKFYNRDGNGLPFHQGVGSYGKRFPTHETNCSANGRKAKEGDILLSVRAPVGRINIADKELIIGRGLAAIRHKKNFQSYLYYLLNYYFRLEDIIGSGSIFNSVGKAELNKFKILQPNNELDKKFDIFVSPMDKKLQILVQQNQLLRQTRDLLLPRLISGKLRVKDIKEP